MDRTVSYNIVLPTFLLDSVFVATWAKMSVIASEASGSFFPKTLRSFKIFTLKKHSRYKCFLKFIYAKTKQSKNAESACQSKFFHLFLFTLHSSVLLYLQLYIINLQKVKKKNICQKVALIYFLIEFSLKLTSAL